MEASITPRKQTSLRLRVDLLERLKAAAQSANSSLNSYIEGILMDDVYRIPKRLAI
jgi:predicted HicB family RNase H-like nuclease